MGNKKKGGFVPIIGLVMLGVIVVTGGIAFLLLSKPQTNQQKPAPVMPTLTANQIESAQYTLPDFGGPFTFNANGAASTSSMQGKANAAEPITLSANLLSDKTAFGDLNGDGAIDAVVPVVEQLGGSGSFYYLVAFLNDNGRPKEAATALLGDRIVVNSITIENGEIAVDMLDHGQNDGTCCATMPVIKHFKLEGTALSSR